jgi:hypothetical protein
MKKVKASALGKHAQDGHVINRPAARASEFFCFRAARSRDLCASVLLTAWAATAVLQGQQTTPQPTFDVTGTAIPAELLTTNFGPLPKGIGGYDLSICNMTDARHSLVSSAIFQALAEAQNTLQPIGRQIMLAAILRNQNHSPASIVSMALGSTTSVLSVVNMNRNGAVAASGLGTGLALGALIAQQVLANWKPVLTADQVEKFESQVLEPALVLDGGSCVERTVFTATTPPQASKPQAVKFHVH